MIKRYDIGRYQGWTPAYSVTSILMQLQSFLFEQKMVDQMGKYGETTKRYFNQQTFDKCYLPQIKSFTCKKCKHSWKKPYPITLTMKQRLSNNNNNKKNSRNNKNVERKMNDDNEYINNSDKKNKEFLFWDGIYRDLEISIFQFFNIQDLLKLRRVAKRFQTLVFNSKIIQV